MKIDIFATKIFKKIMPTKEEAEKEIETLVERFAKQKESKEKKYNYGRYFR